MSWRVFNAVVGTGVFCFFGSSVRAQPCQTIGSDAVKVVVDMDAEKPGCQSEIKVRADENITIRVSVYIFDPRGQAQIWDIGYLGGLDRGISFGHVPRFGNAGSVASVTGVLGQPVHPANTGMILEAPGLDPMFVGPEIQYIEVSPTIAKPGVISAQPADAVFHVDITITDGRPRDSFRFFVGDLVALWSRGQGSFSTQGALSLDTGGDVDADLTETVAGLDADASVPVPPAAYRVDFVDGPGGAMIKLGCGPFGDANGDDVVDILDILCVLDGFQGVSDHCSLRSMDLWPCDGDDVIDLGDIISVLDAFSGRDKCCGVICGGVAGIACDDDAFCKMRIGACERLDSLGMCRPLTSICPEFLDPVCGCDGETYNNECESDAAGVSLAYRGECKEPCGGVAGVLCDDGEFCKFARGTCEVSDNQGVCTEIPTGCPDVRDPVCGCDGVTYGNECEAHAASVSVDRRGACETTCGRSGVAPCDVGEFCKFPDHTCDVTDAQGVCIEIPEGCVTTLWDPVCGCDGVTYGQRCDADAAGVSVDHRGECVAVCGGFAGIPCGDERQFCKLNVGECCCDFQGVCTDIPKGCPDNWDPVCGCDGVTYGNECEADTLGVSVDYLGECGPRCRPIDDTCDDGQFCEIADGLCDVTALGVCRSICLGIFEPVCGCNGISYANRCDAEAAGVLIDRPGECG